MQQLVEHITGGWLRLVISKGLWVKNSLAARLIVASWSTLVREFLISPPQGATLTSANILQDSFSLAGIPLGALISI